MIGGGGGRLRVVYTDGTDEEVKITTAALITAERRWKNQRMPSIEGTLYIAWVSLGKPGQLRDEDVRFDNWFQDVEGCEDLAADDAEVDETPTRPAPGAGPSAG